MLHSQFNIFFKIFILFCFFKKSLFYVSHLLLSQVREDEVTELEEHLHSSCCMPVKGGVENSYGKVNILLQTYISRGMVESFSLVSDHAYISQNASRIMRGLFQMALRKGWSGMAAKLLSLSKSLDHRMWGFEHPIRQFNWLSEDIVRKLEARKATMDRLKDMTAEEIG